jgi:hypothetical protein
VEGDTLLINNFTGKASEINKQLVSNNIDVEHLVVKMRTLEDIFLDITGQVEAV